MIPDFSGRSPYGYQPKSYILPYKMIIWLLFPVFLGTCDKIPLKICDMDIKKFTGICGKWRTEAQALPLHNNKVLLSKNELLFRRLD
jgi:hypothetical protein